MRYSKNINKKTDKLIFAGKMENWAYSYCESIDGINNAFSSKNSYTSKSNKARRILKK